MSNHYIVATGEFLHAEPSTAQRRPSSAADSNAAVSGLVNPMHRFHFRLGTFYFSFMLSVILTRRNSARLCTLCTTHPVFQNRRHIHKLLSVSGPASHLTVTSYWMAAIVNFRLSLSLQLAVKVMHTAWVI
jgi:hypothetical protein